MADFLKGSEIDVNKHIYNLNKGSIDAQFSELADLQNDYDKEAYRTTLSNVQELLSNNHSSELASLIDDERLSSHIKGLITTYIKDQALVVKGLELDILVEKIYDDMAGFGILKKYIYEEQFEEINGNAYNDIEAVTSTGWDKIPEKFISPQQAIDTVKKLCALGGQIIDEKNPTVDSFITKGVRISAMIPPVIDDDCGAAFSIRKQKNFTPSKQQIIDWGTATEEELDFLIFCLDYGISVGIAGATSSGKTTDMNFLLKNISKEKRIYSIEDTRELNAIEIKDDKVISRTIHTRTRHDPTKERNVDESLLLKRALRFHPDLIIPAEMRGAEAFIAQEAGRTGHTILTSFHASDALDAYSRIYTMCLQAKVDIPEHIMMRLIIQAFPIMVFKKQLEDKTRKYMKIVEVYDYENGKVKGKVLYKFCRTGKEFTADGKKTKKVLGEHRKLNFISDRLANRFLENGADIDMIKRFASPDWDPATSLEDGDDI